MATVICENPPFIFTHIPKNGGTSIMSRRSRFTWNLADKLEGVKILGGHVALSTLSKKHDISNYFKFAIVRNPYDRFISLWINHALKHHSTLDRFIQLFKTKSFTQTVTKTQSQWICDNKGNILTDSLLRFENYLNEVNSIINKLDLPKWRIPHLRRLPRKRNYKPYYKKQKQIDFVTNYYSSDIKNFGYSFE